MNVTMPSTRATPFAVAPSRRAPAWGLWVALVSSGLLHTLMALRDRLIWGDEPIYLWLGQNWLHGRGFQLFGFNDVHHSPGYPFLPAVVSLLTGDAAVASTLLYAVFGTLLVLPVYGLARELYDRRVAGWAALIVGLLPAFIVAIPVWGSMTEPPYLFLVAGALYLTLRALQGGRGWNYGLAGLALGLAYLIRPEAIWYFIILGFLLVVVPWIVRRRSWGWLGSLALYGAGFLVSFAPYAYYTYLHTGAWLVSEKVGVTFAHALYLAKNDGVGADRLLWGLDSTGTRVLFYSDESYHMQTGMVQMIQDDPWGFLKHLYRNVRTLSEKLFTLQLFPAFLVPLTVLGLFRAPWDRVRLRGEILLLAALLPPLTFLVFFVLERYYIPLLIPLGIWAGKGLDELGDWLAETWHQARGRALSDRANGLARGALVALAALTLVALQPRGLVEASRVRSFRPEHKTVGLWLRDHTPADARIMARYPAIAYHANRPWVPSPHAELDQVIRYMQAQKADYWVIDGWELDWRPELAFLAEGPTLPDMELVYFSQDGPAPLLVYRTRPPCGCSKL